MVEITTGSMIKPVASEQLKNFFRNSSEYRGELYIGYPVIGTIEGAYSIDALWISPDKGIIAFNLIEDSDVSGYEDAQDDCANKLEAKLRGHRELMNRRNLCISINCLTYAPRATYQLQTYSENDFSLCTDYQSIKKAIDSISWTDVDSYYEKAVSVLQAVSTIRSEKRKRIVSKENSRGAKLQKLEASIANLDHAQSRAVIETVEGVQRIRGLAGSGKTIVLALKAAYLHALHQDWKIAVTFNTRSLKGQFERLIRTFYMEQANDEPDWDNLMILQGWGSPGGGAFSRNLFSGKRNERAGIYYLFCESNNVEYWDFTSARNQFGPSDPFASACEKALNDVASKGDMSNVSKIFDAILVDEAQDLSPAFLRMCYEMLKEPKRLVYAYDELQSLNLKSLPPPENIFGELPDHTPKVRFKSLPSGEPQQDIILDICYRNSRPLLVTAHALGFGIYRQPKGNVSTGLVQMFDRSSLWGEIGYQATQGSLEDGKLVTLERTTDSSPKFLENHSTLDDLILFHAFETKDAQDEWVAKEIVRNLREDELYPSDIIVINPNPLTTKRNLASIRSLLYQEGIQSHTAGVDTTPDVFFSENNDSVTFTGIYRAKGNEGAMVYVVNAESCFDSNFNLAALRNQLFTAITRSKAWVRVLGVGPCMKGLINEFEQVKTYNFTLKFVYPTEEQRKTMNIVNRDMSEAERTQISRSRSDLARVVDALEKKQIHLEDLGEDQLNRLRTLLKIGG